MSPHDAGKNYCLSAEKIVIDVLTSNKKKKNPEYNDQIGFLILSHGRCHHKSINNVIVSQFYNCDIILWTIIG